MIDLRNLFGGSNRRRWTVGGVLVLLLATFVVVYQLFFSHYRRLPSIFDAPVDNIFGFMSEEEFNALSVDERMSIIRDILSRFSGVNQGDSAVAAAFLAGLSGPAMEKLANNARILGKDVLLEGAGEWATLLTEAEKEAFLDQWIVKWVRFAEESGGRDSNQTDQQILDRMTRQAKRDVERNQNIDADMAQQVIDFWRQDIASVTTPLEQAQLYQFVPAIRDRLLRRGNNAEN